MSTVTLLDTTLKESLEWATYTQQHDDPQKRGVSDDHLLSVCFRLHNTFAVHIFVHISAGVTSPVAPGWGAEYCHQRFCICLSACLPARVSQKPHVHISPNFLSVSPVAVARSSSDGSATRYVLPSCFHIME